MFKAVKLPSHDTRVGLNRAVVRVNYAGHSMTVAFCKSKSVARMIADGLNLSTTVSVE